MFLSLIAFLGGALAYRARHHSTVEFLTAKLPANMRVSVAVGIDLLVLVGAAVVGYVSLNLLSIASMSNTPILDINAAWLMLPLTIGLALVVIFALERLVFEYAPRHVLPAVIVVALLVGVVYTASVVPSLRLSNGAALGVMLIAFLFAVLLGIAGELRHAARLADVSVDQRRRPLIAAAQNTFDGTSNFILLTLPFFIWAGLIMEKGGISLRLVRFAMTLVGRVRAAACCRWWC